MVGFIGRLTDDKGIGALVDAVRLLQDSGLPIVLLVVGELDTARPLFRATMGKAARARVLANFWDVDVWEPVDSFLAGPTPVAAPLACDGTSATDEQPAGRGLCICRSQASPTALPGAPARGAACAGPDQPVGQVGAADVLRQYSHGRYARRVPAPHVLAVLFRSA